MGMRVEIAGLSYGVGRKGKKIILQDINLSVSPGSFVAVLGENGAGKTTLLDLMMGFRKATSGTVAVDGEEPFRDHWRKRQRISYMSEKVDMPGDWSVAEFLEFNRFFYENYSLARERELLAEFRVDTSNRVGNLSAGEIRRFQVVAGLSADPQLIVVDEITAVLDIVGRRKFMRAIHEINRKTGCTVVLATNIPEDLAGYISDILILSHGRAIDSLSLTSFLADSEPSQFAQLVADRLEKE